MEREQLEQAIAALEAQRAALGESVADQAIASLREKLAALQPETAGVSAIASRAGAPTAVRRTGERRVITILFCDVKGSTAMAEKLDPEEWAGIIRPAIDYLIEPVERHGGTVTQVMGDGLLALFGAPLAHEDDPRRAVQAGLEIVERIRSYHDQIQRERGLNFDVRVGIHTGLAVVQEVGSGQKVDYTAIGDTVNLAARMEQTARPGTVQVSSQTHRFVEQIFEFEPLGEIRVKGKRERVETYRVTGVKAEPGPLRGLEQQGLHSPLVGREAELRAAQESVARLRAGQGGLLGILGEAGVGKSRLLAELQRTLPVDELYWLEGHTLAYGQTISYWPFQEILRCFADINDSDEEDLAWCKLESTVTALFPENVDGSAPTVAEIAPYLASLMGLKVKGEYAERVIYLDGEAMGRQIFLAARRFFERLAQTRPVVLVIDDLHWVDESSVRLLEHLLPLVQSVPLLVIGLSRRDRESAAAQLADTIRRDYAAYYTEIQLQPLSESDSARLVRNLLELESLPGQVQKLITGKAEGNPFYLEEILRALMDLGAIRREATSGRWMVTAQIEGLDIPDTVQGVILARMDRLEDGVKSVLRVAAVIGRSFLYRVLQAIADSGGVLDAQLAELLSADLIQEKHALPDLEFLFRHALAHEATYESILIKTRRELHGRVGLAIETLFADRLEEFYGLLAYHFARAEAWEKAQAYLLKAADQASRMAADAEALANYQEALDAYARAYGDQWDPVQRAGLERRIGEAYFRRGEINKSLESYLLALELLGNPPPKAGRSLGMSLLKEIGVQVGHALLPGLSRKHAPGPAAEEELRIYQDLIFSGGGGNPNLFLLVAFRMLNFSERNDLPAGVAAGSAGLGVLFYYVNFPRIARHYIDRAVKLSNRLQRADLLGLAPTVLMLLEAGQGDWEAVTEEGRRAADNYREIGNLGAWAVSISVAASLCVARGDFEQALAYGQEQAQFGRDAADRLMWGDALGVQGFAEQRLGRLDEALLHLKQAVEITEASGNLYFRLLVGNDLGQCYLRRGDWQAALETLETNRKLIQGANFKRDPGSNSGLCIGLAWAHLMAAEQGKPGDRAAHLKQAEAAAKGALKWAKDYPLANPGALRMQGLFEWLKGSPARAGELWQKSLAEADRLRTRHELGLTHLEIGQRLGERQHLEQAAAIFSEVGAALDLHVASELLAWPGNS